MNGPQDVGGMMGFGPVRPEADEPAFHAPWEGRALGLTLCAGALGRWTLDESRHARESLSPAIYYNASYYEIWLRALEALLVKHGLVSAKELAEGTSPEAPPHPKRLPPERVEPAMKAGTPYDRPLATTPRFRPGEKVRARNIHPRGHTRLPRYVRGHVGVIEADRGGFVLPDASAHELGEGAERLYTVVFEAETLWGPDAEPGTQISVDAWESYLEPA
ncbi:MAG: nitrile hydratase subunit beta [Pararhodobacter sp.]|nr:nitrile hydratase subunit beta [Pararhodobacter sp.]